MWDHNRVNGLELLAHPVRLRIVHALSGGRTLTTSQLCKVLADVPKTTVYRHVAQLADGGMLEVDGERRVRGVVERSYRLRRERTLVDAETAASATSDEHRHIFAAAMAAMIAEFNGYLDRDDADPAADMVGYRQHTLWLTQDELSDLIQDMRAAILPRLANEPTAQRARHLLSPIHFPIEKPAS
jgi:DNA-binding transcriptional ArsR family regulator